MQHYSGPDRAGPPEQQRREDADHECDQKYGVDPVRDGEDRRAGDDSDPGAIARHQSVGENSAE